MKLSSKARYGLKAMCYLARNYDSGTKSLPIMAADLEMSEKYLEQLLGILRKSNLVSATRGASGGYSLAKEPHTISIGEILRELEDGLVIVDCLQNGCSNQSSCVTYDVWNKLYKEINGFLDSMSLGSILEK